VEGHAALGGTIQTWTSGGGRAWPSCVCPITPPTCVWKDMLRLVGPYKPGQAVGAGHDRAAFAQSPLLLGPAQPDDNSAL